MKNGLKWLIAIPLILFVALGIPFLITGDFLWFLDSWSDTLVVLFVLASGIAAAIFVDSERSNRRLSLSRILISFAFIMIVPIAVFERTYGPGVERSAIWSLVGLAFCAIAAPMGIVSRWVLGRNYVPDPEILPEQAIVTRGPYRFIRHPLYTTALLWAVGLSLLARSLWGLAAITLLLLPAILLRIREEEAMLMEGFGDEYRSYAEGTWALLPYIY